MNTAQGIMPSAYLIQSFSNGVVGDITNTQEILGQAGSTLDAYLKGTVTAIMETGDNLGKAVEKDKAQVQKEKEEENNGNSNGENSAQLQSTQVDTKKLEQNGDAA